MHREGGKSKKMSLLKISFFDDANTLSGRAAKASHTVLLSV